MRRNGGVVGGVLGLNRTPAHDAESNMKHLIPTVREVVARFGVTETQASRCIPDKPPHDTWEYSSVMTWIRNRLYDANAFATGLARLPQDDSGPFLKVLLHIGFIGISETPEMILRLHNKKAAKTAAYQVARSKLPKTLEIVRPVDRTAWQVIGHPHG